jgi:hypothetical protein
MGRHAPKGEKMPKPQHLNGQFPVKGASAMRCYKSFILNLTVGGGGLPDGEWEGLVNQDEGGRRHEVDLDVAAAGQQALQLGRLQSTLNSKN